MLGDIFLPFCEAKKKKNYRRALIKNYINLAFPPIYFALKKFPPLERTKWFDYCTLQKFSFKNVGALWALRSQIMWVSQTTHVWTRIIFSSH
jgi:hypothetical protein